MRRSVLDGAGYAVMYSMGEMYLPAFVLALTSGDTASGLVATVPPAAGAVLQLAAPLAIRALGSHKKWVVFCSAIQALAFVPLIAAALLGTFPTWALFGVVSWYFVSGMAGGAAWSTWISTFVPTRIHARWFGFRQRSLQIAMLSGFLLGGLILSLVTGGVPPESFPDRLTVVRAFAILFAIAGAARVFSTLLLARQPEPVPMPPGHRHVGLGEFLHRARVGDELGRGVRLLLYMFAARLAEHIAAPFVAPYVLKELGRAYPEYTALVGATMVGKIVVLGALGGISHRYGPRIVLIVAGVAITPLGWLWLVSSSFPWLLGVQLVSGAAWGAYELSTWLLILRHIREDERTSLMGAYFVGHWGSCAAGSLLGGWLLETLGHGGAAYWWIFALSSLARVFTLAPLALVVRRESSAPEPALQAVGPEFDPEARGAGRGDE